VGIYVRITGKANRGFTLVEVLVVCLILGVLTAVAIPLYFKSVDDSETNACKTNMDSIAAAVQANKAKAGGGSFWVGTVDSTATASDGPLADLHLALPECPAGPGDLYSVSSDNAGGFIVRCSNPRHHFQWHNGIWETY
jgi:prepilin-type N-terminal cleavage/methylation domain-containing protein